MRHLSGIYREAGAATRDIGLAGVGDRPRGVAVAIHIDAVIARAQRDRGVGRVHFKSFVRPHGEDVDVERAGGEAQLHRAIVQVQERQRGFRTHADGRGANVHFGLRSRIGPEVVAGGQGIIEAGRGPVFHGVGAKGNLSAEIVQTGRARGRVDGLSHRCPRRGDEKNGNPSDFVGMSHGACSWYC